METNNCSSSNIFFLTPSGNLCKWVVALVPVLFTTFFFSLPVFSSAKSNSAAIASDSCFFPPSDSLYYVVGASSRLLTLYRNPGPDTIRSIQFHFIYKDSVYGGEIMDLNILPGEIKDIRSNELFVINEDLVIYEVGISQINGQAPSIDSKDTRMEVKAYRVEFNRNVLGELSTGTWCGWCPRGMYYSEILQEKYGNRYTTISVHNADPMMDADYDKFLGRYRVAFPSELMNRTVNLSPENVELALLEEWKQKPALSIEHVAYELNASNQLMVRVRVSFHKRNTEQWKLMLILKEDHVKGNSINYSQKNYYADGSSGAMGGYEKLPGLIRNTYIQYQDVARKIYPDFYGVELVEKGQVTDSGTVLYYEAIIQLDTSWKWQNLELVSLVSKNNREIENVFSSTLDSALKRGASGVLDVKKAPGTEVPLFSFYPNPFSDWIICQPAEPMQLTLLSAEGKIIWTRWADETVTITTAALPRGVYTLIGYSASGTTTKILIK